MQPSKIKNGEIYAIKHNSKLVRFRANSVTVKRDASGTTASVEGTIISYDSPTGEAIAHTLNADYVIGPYTEQPELREREKKEREDRLKESELVKQRARLLYETLIKEFGFPNKSGYNRYDMPVTLAYNEESIEIRGEGITALLKHFNVEIPEPEQKDSTVVNLR